MSSAPPPPLFDFFDDDGGSSPKILSVKERPSPPKRADMIISSHEWFPPDQTYINALSCELLDAAGWLGMDEAD